MGKKTVHQFRGDSRDEKTLESHGGFVPPYLLEKHLKTDGKTGLDAFIACKLKTDKTMGCGCPGFSEKTLYENARKMFLTALGKPVILQDHVAFNNQGFLSTAKDKSDTYFGHNYQITTNLHELTVYEAVQKYKQEQSPWWKSEKKKEKFKPYPPKLFTKMRVYLDNLVLDQATLIAMTPLGGVEATYISPVKFKHIKYLGLKK